MLYFDNGKTNLDYKCHHIHTEIPAPEPKRYTVEIPLRDGLLDVTGALSSFVFYGERELVFGLEMFGLRMDWPAYYSALCADLHGKRVEISTDEDPNYKWIGYAYVGDYEDHGASAGITVTLRAEPFKRKTQKSELYYENIGGSDEITFTTTAPRTYFYFTTSEIDATVTYNGQTWTLPTGTSNGLGLVMTPGSHTLDFHGYDDLLVETEEGWL